jgi:predicted nucleic acid-binding protein
VLDQILEVGAVVPALWRVEVANAFQSALRRRRVTALYRDESLTQLAAMPISVDGDTDTYAWTTTLGLAERFGLTVYDATYLELAKRRSLPLASLDKALREAATALNVTLLGLDV